MKIELNKPAKIYFKEKTVIIEDFGAYLKGCILDMGAMHVPNHLWEFYEQTTARTLLVKDSWGNEFNIPYDTIESIRYLKSI